MTNVSHASLTGSQLHEPKGADTAALGTVYVANGAGSGSWASVGTSSFTGMIADFPAPVAPTGWLELNGSTISTSTYSALYAVMTIQSSGSRTNGSPVLTSVPDTSNIKVGYYVFGTGIASGSTVVSVDSASQITISNNASSSGSASFAVSPWLLNTGTIQLPDVTTNGRYRRSRTSTTKVGDLLADQNQSHTHTASATSSSTTDGNHYHTAGIYDPGHAHGYTAYSGIHNDGTASFDCPVGPYTASTGSSTTGVRLSSSNGTDTTNSAGSHTHTITTSVTNTAQGGTEARPVTLVVLTCVKT